MSIIRDPYRRDVARTATRLGTALSGVAVVVTLIGMALGAVPGSAAATNGGPAAIVSPTSGSPLTSGGSATAFTIKLPADASCSGDSANGGYRVQSYMVQGAVDPSTLTFGELGPLPSGFGADPFRQPLYSTTSTAYANAQTANAVTTGGPGQIVNIPAFDLAVFTPGDVPAGPYNVGIACTKGEPSATQLDKYWNLQITVALAPSDSPAGVTWTVDGGTTTTSTTTPSTSSSTSTSTSIPPSTTSTTTPPTSSSTSTSTSTSIATSTTSTTTPSTSSSTSTSTSIATSTTSTSVPDTTTSTVPTSTTSTTAGATTTSTSSTTSTTGTSSTTSTTAGETTTSTAPDCSTTSTSSAATCVPEGTSVAASAAPGGQLAVMSDGWKPGSSVTAVLNSDPVTLGTLTASSSGVVSASLTVPSSVPVGEHTLVLTGTSPTDVARTVRAPVTISSATSTTASTGSIPRTGSSTMPLLISSALLLAFGTAALRLGRSSRLQPPLR